MTPDLKYADSRRVPVPLGMFNEHRRCGDSGNYCCHYFNGSYVPSVPISEDAPRSFMARNCTFLILRHSAVLSSEERMEVLFCYVVFFIGMKTLVGVPWLVWGSSLMFNAGVMYYRFLKL
jgi:hypothetical protein